MSTEPKRQQSDKKNTEDTEVEIVPEGTFGGTIEKPILVKRGETDTREYRGRRWRSELSRFKKYLIKQIDPQSLAAHFAQAQ